MADSNSTAPMLYMIRHGEKPPKVDGKDPPGLSPDGEKRAQALVEIFNGKDSKYDLGLIIAQTPGPDGEGDRPSLTVQPLVDSLGKNVKFVTKFESEETKEVAKYIREWNGPGNILVCWEHHHLYKIAMHLKLQNAQPYPDDRFDVIWTITPPFDSIDGVSSEHVERLDAKYARCP